MANITDDAKSLAITCLQTLPEVQLPAEQWQEIETQLHRLQDALNRDDGDAFRQARDWLGELRRPRIGRIGDPALQPTPPPEPIREFINSLVDTLTPRGTNPPSEEHQDAPKQSDKRR